MLLSASQSGWDTEVDRAATALPRWASGGDGCSSMRSTSGCDAATEATNAAGACRAAPPRELGRVAFPHDQSVVGPPRIASRVFRIAESNSWAAGEMWSGGQVRRT